MTDLVTSLKIKQSNGEYTKQDIGVEAENVIGLDEIVDNLETKITPSFKGSHAKWEALTPEQKAQYIEVIFTDDYTDESIMQGATASTNGVEGLVPQPLAGDEDKVLKGNGKWSDDVHILIKYGNWRTGIREKNLGNSFTTEQRAALVAGDFSEFWNGDYWEFPDGNGGTRKCRIVDNTNYFKGMKGFNKNCLVIKYDGNLVKKVNIDTLDSEHGYKNCFYRTDDSGRAACKAIYTSDFGNDYIATHAELMSQERGAMGPISNDWEYAADVELPNQVNITGCNIWHTTDPSVPRDGTGYNVGTNWKQFKLYSLVPYYAFHIDNPSFIEGSWLRDIIFGNDFLTVTHEGIIGTYLCYRDVGMRFHGYSPYAVLVGE